MAQNVLDENKPKHCSLCDLPQGARAYILALRGSLEERQKLHALGLRKGSTKKDKGCPCLVQIGECRVALSSCLFEKIVVRVA